MLAELAEPEALLAVRGAEVCLAAGTFSYAPLTGFCSCDWFLDSPSSGSGAEILAEMRCLVLAVEGALGR